jgi:hypothetical protein
MADGDCRVAGRVAKQLQNTEKLGRPVPINRMSKAEAQLQCLLSYFFRLGVVIGQMGGHSAKTGEAVRHEEKRTTPLCSLTDQFISRSYAPFFLSHTFVSLFPRAEDVLFGVYASRIQTFFNCPDHNDLAYSGTLVRLTIHSTVTEQSDCQGYYHLSYRWSQLHCNSGLYHRLVVR